MTHLLTRTSQVLRRDVLGRFKPGIWAITLAGFLNAAGFSISLPFISLYLYQNRGLSMTAVGGIILGTGLFSAAAQAFSGVLTDRMGRRPMLLFSVSAGILFQASMAWLVATDASIAYIVVAYAGVRAGLMMGRPAMSAMIVDLAPRERLTEAYGVLRMGQNLGWAAGPAVGGYLVGSLTYGWLFTSAALMGTVTLSVVFLALRESFQGSGGQASNVRSLFSGGVSTGFLQFIALNLLIFLVMGQMTSTLSVFTVDRAGFTTERYGLLLTLNGIVVVLLQYPVTRILGFVSRSAALVTGCLLYGAGYLAMAWVGGFPLAAGAMTVITLGEIVLAPTTLAVVGELAPHDWRGRYMGLYGLSETVGMAAGPLVGGVLLDAFPATPLFIWGTIALLTLAPAVGFRIWCSRRQTASRSC